MTFIFLFGNSQGHTKNGTLQASLHFGSEQPVMHGRDHRGLLGPYSPKLKVGDIQKCPLKN